MKPVSEWTLEDVQQLVSSHEPESLNLDYKRSAALSTNSKQRDEVSKDVSAFANSDGGVIIYGVAEELRDGLPVPTFVDSGIDSKAMSHETLERIINTNIHPRIPGVTVKQIPLFGSSVIYVVSVPKSLTLAPHQAADKRYYRRYNFESVPLHHYEILDIMRRGSVPDLRIQVIAKDFTLGDEGALGAELTCTIHNNAPETAVYVNCQLLFDRRLGIAKINEFKKVQTQLPFDDGVNVPMDIFMRNSMPPHHMPVFKEIAFTLATAKATIPKGDIKYLIGYQLACPGFSIYRLGVVSRIGDQITVDLPEEDNAELVFTRPAAP